MDKSKSTPSISQTSAPTNSSNISKPSPVGVNRSSSKDYSKFSDTPPEEVNKFHTRDDVDTGAFAHHHTLGFRRDQASPGDHSHDGRTSKKLGNGLGYVVTGSKGGNAALTSLLAMLANVIDFEDTTS
jgi:hypothetical protein